MKGFLTPLTKQTLIGIHTDFKPKTFVDTVTSWKGVCEAYKGLFVPTRSHNSFIQNTQNQFLRSVTLEQKSLEQINAEFPFRFSALTQPPCSE